MRCKAAQLIINLVAGYGQLGTCPRQVPTDVVGGSSFIHARYERITCLGDGEEYIQDTSPRYE